jgi:putative salt-induced outer membrane protein YdiY
MLRTASFALAVVLLAAASSADEVTLKNGDRLTGTLVEITKDKLVLKTDYAGDLKLDRASIASIRTDAPVTVVLADGSRFERKLEPAEPGIVKFADAPGAPSIGAVPLDQVGEVNPPKKEIKWTGAAALGADFTRGNTRNDRIHMLIDAVRRTDEDRLTVDAGWNYARSRAKDSNKDETTERNVFGAVKYDYFFTEKFFGYGQTRAEGDKFKDLELRYTAGLGVGYQWVEEDNLKFYTEGGLSYFYENFTNAPTDDYLAARLAYRLDWTPVDWLTFIHDTEWFPSLADKDDQFVRTDFTVRVPIAGHLKAEASAMYEWDNTPSPDSKRLDEKYLIGIAYTF